MTEDSVSGQLTSAESALAAFWQSVIASQRRLCAKYDSLLPAELRVDGCSRFKSALVLPHVKSGMLVYDVGGGKRPFFSPGQKLELGIRVVGLDISAAELAAAPAGSYDKVVRADVGEAAGEGDADLVVCQAVLEHVRDTERALAAIASMLAPGGKALIFVPCRNALFARLNRLLPQKWKKRLLFGLFPHVRAAQGFPSFYDRCTPDEFRAIGAAHQLTCEQETCFYMSAYFSFFLPFYLLWRFWMLLARTVGGAQYCETFAMVLCKTAPR